MNFQIYSNGKKVTDKILLSQFHTEDIGIFESLRTYGGGIFQVEEHLDRLFESAKTAGWDWGLSPKGQVRAKLRRELESAIRAFRQEEPAPIQEDLFIRLTLFRGQVFVMLGIRAHAKRFAAAAFGLA